MEDRELKKHVLVGKKTERIVFAATPEMKQALEKIAEEECTSISALMSSAAADVVLSNKKLFEGEGF